MAQSTPLFVGLDVHKDSIAVAHAAGGSTEPPVFVGAIGPRQADVDQLLRRLLGKTAALQFAYEAGPTGYGLKWLPDHVAARGIFESEHESFWTIRTTAVTLRSSDDS